MFAFIQIHSNTICSIIIISVHSLLPLPLFLFFSLVDYFDVSLFVKLQEHSTFIGKSSNESRFERKNYNQFQ